MGNIKVAYQMSSATVNNSIDTNDRKFKASQIGLQYTMGNTSVFGVSGSGDVKKNDGTKTNDIKNTQFGVRHNLSKRTTAYVMTGTSKDSAIAASDTTRAKEAKFSGVGLSHAF
jgi:predicted porin